MIVIFVQQTRLLRFQIFHLEMDSTIKPIHYFIHSEQISKLEKIKAHWTPTKRLASSSESPNPRIGYRTWSSENGIGPHSNQGRTDTRMPGSLPDSLSKAIRWSKYIIPTVEENLHKLHGMRYLTIIDVKETFQNTHT